MLLQVVRPSCLLFGCTDWLLEHIDSAWVHMRRNHFMLTEAFVVLTTDCIALQRRLQRGSRVKLAWLKFNSSEICTGISDVGAVFWSQWTQSLRSKLQLSFEHNKFIHLFLFFFAFAYLRMAVWGDSFSSWVLSEHHSLNKGGICGMWQGYNSTL